ncbi:MAG: hypothetical protein WCV59_00060 [Parcubacteria group bacterium]
MADVTNSLLYFYNSTTFSVIKFIIGIYVAVIFVDIILFLFQRGLGGDVRDTRLGMNVPKEFLRKKPRQKLAMRWKKLREEIETGENNKIKVAIISADDIIANLIRRMYAGAPFAKKEIPIDEMLNAIPDGQIENMADIKNSHLERNRIIHDESFHPTKEEAYEILAPFEEFLRYHGVLD